MSEIFCPNCGKTHSTNKKNCASCGEDLEDIILDFKNKHLPITFNNGKKKEAQPTDEWEKQRQTILKIKEQEKARERIERLEEQQQISKSEKTRKRRKRSLSRKTCWDWILEYLLSCLTCGFSGCWKDRV